jgi:hypothetical protein
VTYPPNVPGTPPESLLRTRFRELVGEYDVLVHGGMGARASERAEEVRQELDRLADALNGLEGCT